MQVLTCYPACSNRPALLFALLQVMAVAEWSCRACSSRLAVLAQALPVAGSLVEADSNHPVLDFERAPAP